MASPVGDLADVESCLFVSWALLWVHQQHPCRAPWLPLLRLRQSLCSKYWWLISPPPSPRFLVVQSKQTLAIGAQLPFPDCSLGKDKKWLKARTQSCVCCESGPWEKLPPLMSLLQFWSHHQLWRWLQLPLRERRAKITSLPTSLSPKKIFT